MARLGEICNYITDGSHNPPQGLVNSDYRMLSSKNIDDDRITLESPRYLSPADFEAENKRTEIVPGDLLMTIVGTIGRVAVVPEDMPPFCVQRSVAVIKSKHDIIYNRFLMYQLQNMRPLLEEESRGVAQKGIYLKQLSNLSIVIPSLAEQRKIVSILDKVSSLIALRKQQLDKLDELVKARFVEMFGDPERNPYHWDIAALKDIAIGKLSYGSGAAATDFDGETRYIRITDITSNGEISSDIKSPDRIDEKYILHDGDILFARTGATVGKTLMYRESYGRSIYAGFLIRLIPDKKKVLPQYVFAFTKSDFYSRFIASTQRVVAQPNINAQEYGDLKICVPPMEMQKEFAAFVRKIDQCRLTIQQGLDKIEMSKNALMQECFG